MAIRTAQTGRRAALPFPLATAAAAIVAGCGVDSTQPIAS